MNCNFSLIDWWWQIYLYTAFQHTTDLAIQYKIYNNCFSSKLISSTGYAFLVKFLILFRISHFNLCNTLREFTFMWILICVHTWCLYAESTSGNWKWGKQNRRTQVRSQPGPFSLFDCQRRDHQQDRNQLLSVEIATLLGQCAGAASEVSLELP